MTGIVQNTTLIAFESPTTCEACGEVWDAASWVSCPRCQITSLREALDKIDGDGCYTYGYDSCCDHRCRQIAREVLAAVPSPGPAAEVMKKP